MRERIGRWSTVEDISATRCRVRMTAGSLDWATMALGAVGADFQVVSPPELLDRIHDWGRRFSRANVITQHDQPGTALAPPGGTGDLRRPARSPR